MFFNKRDTNKETKKIVMAFGIFDNIHGGHEYLLKKAKEYGDELIVIIARDQTTRSIKGINPVNNENKRLRNLKKTGLADKVVLGNHGDKHKVILQYKPDIIVLGFNQYAFTQTLQKTLIDNHLNSEIIRIEPFYPQVHKSSILKTSMKENLKLQKISETQIVH